MALIISVMLLPIGALITDVPDRRLKVLERSVVCAEALRDDDERRAAVRNFVQRYGAINPASHIGERLAARDRILKRRRCREEPDHHNFPEL